MERSYQYTYIWGNLPNKYNATIKQEPDKEIVYNFKDGYYT